MTCIDWKTHANGDIQSIAISMEYIHVYIVMQTNYVRYSDPKSNTYFILLFFWNLKHEMNCMKKNRLPRFTYIYIYIYICHRLRIWKHLVCLHIQINFTQVIISTSRVETSEIILTVSIRWGSYAYFNYWWLPHSILFTSQ